ncbi:MAG: peptidoglycan editing factor PgeF [Anaerolineales bacterium]|nr:peptidoglycan editing factor PgeF [Anaerolineales bacterium]MCS7248948.1 peptidoglycan editing factor PgeF [Anaerolineales bacterium]MDW8162761.1 peptidoglycan editing factor PgeF [Anaerolineales bacterium]MDW8445865.1 peptidoglycan editing factor PgeF [Anaerolineales bacterium]
MRHFTVNGLHYYTFETLDRYGVCHAIFTRKGGVSPPPWASLNVGGTVGDDMERVRENRKRTFEALGLSSQRAYDVWQVHSAEVLCVDAPRAPDQIPQKADALLTNKRNVHLFMRFADCVPILLFDRARGVIGIVHAGWQGTINRIAEKAVYKMEKEYGSAAEDIWAGIGPSVGAHHYPVGEEIWESACSLIPEVVQQSFGVHQGKYWFDLWTANKLLLEGAGVGEVEVAGICTACNLEEWYSHRAEYGKTGRFGVVISL